MNTRRDGSRGSRRRAFLVEALEGRALLTTTETFTGPSLTDLIQSANRGQDTASEGINRMLQALESQIESGPLADLNAGTVDNNGFVAEVQSLEQSYEQDVDQQLSPEFPNVDELLKLQGMRVVADLVSLNQQESVGLLDSTDFATQAQTAVSALTAGPIYSLGTPVSAYATATQNFESNLNALAQDLGSSATTSLTASQVSTTVIAEAEAYRADLHAALQVTHPPISQTVNAAVDALETAAGTIATEDSATAQTDLTSAISTFDAALLGTTGLFGTQGPIAVALSRGLSIPASRTANQVATTLGSVSGTATGGTSTLTATLTATSGQALSGQSVSFTLDGAFAGTAVTDSDGVATLSGVATSDATGTDSGGIVASFAGNRNNQASQGVGDLTVS